LFTNYKLLIVLRKMMDFIITIHSLVHAAATTTQLPFQTLNTLREKAVIDLHIAIVVIYASVDEQSADRTSDYL